MAYGALGAEGYCDMVDDEYCVFGELMGWVWALYYSTESPDCMGTDCVTNSLYETVWGP